MGKLKQQMIISQELAQVAAESWEHTVMSNLCDYVKIHGVSDFKDALMMFNKDVYNDIFHPQDKINTECYLTNPK